jgi:hypothetical protein
MRFDGLMAVRIQITAFRGVTLCSLVEGCQRFGERDGVSIFRVKGKSGL